MAFAAAMERRVSNPASSQWERLILGSFLAMSWGGLRWEKLQRSSPNSLVLDGHVLRGVAWRSKTNRTGLPYGFWTFGLTARPPDLGWAHWWFEALQSWVASVRADAGPNVVIDYLLPTVVKGKIMARPMSYFHALRLLRWFLTQPWMRIAVGCVAKPESYSLHLKATLTSWAVQCQVPEHLRADLGHHRLRGNSKTVQLYSRDDVWGALQAQRCIILKAAQGWRPLTPQARGGQKPIDEPRVALPGPPDDWDTPPQRVLATNRIDVASLLDLELGWEPVAPKAAPSTKPGKRKPVGP